MPGVSKQEGIDKSGVIIQGCQSSGHQLGLLPDSKGAGDSTACEGLGEKEAANKYVLTL